MILLTFLKKKKKIIYTFLVKKTQNPEVWNRPMGGEMK